MSATKIPMSKALQIPMKECASSQVHSYGFDPDTNTLAMRFHQKGGVSATYHYTVTPEQFAALEGAESKGRYFGEHIKCLDCMKLVADEELEKSAA